MTRPTPHTAEVQNLLQDSLFDHVGRLPAAWQETLLEAPTQQTLLKLDAFLEQRRRQGAQIFPGRPFRALEHVTPEGVQVVILGQDPYHGPNQAQGLAFSVPDETPMPPSLRNIFAELRRVYPAARGVTGHDLTAWARQGALLLNAVLTVESGRPASHAKQGWEAVTDALIRRVAHAAQPKVFMLWGAYAQAKQALIPTGPGHPPALILTANHPSPLAARRPPKPFIGCDHFIKANLWLEQHGAPGIQW